MYFCSADESGNDDVSTCLVMVGVLVDSTRLSRTQDEFGASFQSLTALTGQSLRELKSTDVLPGGKAWRVEGETRRNVITNLCG